jgi:hypothetical protein
MLVRYGTRRHTSGAKAPFLAGFPMPGLKPRPTSEATASAKEQATASAKNKRHDLSDATSGAKALFLAGFPMPGLKPRPTSEATASAKEQATASAKEQATASAKNKRHDSSDATSGAEALFLAGSPMPGLKPRPTSEATASARTKYRDLSTAAAKCAAFGRDDVCFGRVGREQSKAKEAIIMICQTLPNRSPLFT